MNPRNRSAHSATPPLERPAAARNVGRAARAAAWGKAPWWARRWVQVAALVWTAFVVGSHWFAAMAGCAMDTSYCADSRHKDGVYTGFLVDGDGRPAASKDFSMSFESRHQFGRQGLVKFTSRPDGSFCIVWGQEAIKPGALVDDDGRQYVGQDATWRPLRGQDPPAGCQTSRRGIPWHRALDYASSPQYLLVLMLGAAGGLALVAGRALSATRRAGLALTAATTAAALAVWFLP